MELTEGGDAVVADLPDQVVAWLVDRRVVTAQLTRSGSWEVAAARKVGVVRIGPVTVWAKPKIEVSRIIWMLGWASKPGWQRDDPVGLAPAEDLVPALAAAFASQAERALQRGLLHGYRTVDADLAVLRGRLRAGDQLRRRYGVAVPLAVRYQDHLADIAENQLLRAATTRLLHLPGVDASTRSRLLRLRGLLDDVSDLVPERPLPVWHRSRLNERYHSALDLAEIVLASSALEHEPGRLRVDGFLVDMYQLFEDFVTAVLSRELERIGGHCIAQHRHWLDEEQVIEIRPDLVWQVGGQCRAVIDAKYKAERVSGFPQADLYQAAAYATAYGLDRAHLVYAKGNEPAATWTVRNAGVRITAHALELAATPEVILRELCGIGRQIAVWGQALPAWSSTVVATGRCPLPCG